MPTKKKKRASGGARAVKAKHAKREAARARAEAPKPIEPRDAIGQPPTDPEQGFSYLSQVILEQIHEARMDVGMPPESKREQIGRLVAQAAKVMEPAKLSAKLAEYARVLEEQKAHAAPVTGPTDGAAGSAAFIE